MTTLHPSGCLCGKVRFEAAVEPLRIVHCHCIFCRRQTGGPVNLRGLQTLYRNHLV